MQLFSNLLLLLTFFHCSSYKIMNAPHFWLSQSIKYKFVVNYGTVFLENPSVRQSFQKSEKQQQQQKLLQKYSLPPALNKNLEHRNSQRMGKNLWSFQQVQCWYFIPENSSCWLEPSVFKNQQQERNRIKQMCFPHTHTVCPQLTRTSGISPFLICRWLLLWFSIAFLFFQLYAHIIWVVSLQKEPFPIVLEVLLIYTTHFSFRKFTTDQLLLLARGQTKKLPILLTTDYIIYFFKHS